jgi:small subunit ribosomal protein S15
MGSLCARRSLPPPTMALKKASKKKIIGKFQTHAKDTGSPQVQVGILTKRVDQVTKHLKEHKKDNSARRGLLAMVAQRRKLLTYLKMNAPKYYEKIIKALDLEK